MSGPLVMGTCKTCYSPMYLAGDKGLRMMSDGGIPPKMRELRVYEVRCKCGYWEIYRPADLPIK